MFVVNAPMLFAGVWAVCKGFLDEKTRAKIKIIGSTFLPTLTEFIDLAKIPTFLGGQCTCLAGGGCMKANPGPWNYYVHTPPRGIKKKMDLEKEREEMLELATRPEEKHHEETKTEEVKETVQPKSAPIVNEASESKNEEQMPATEPVKGVSEVQQLAAVETMVENLSLKEDGQTEQVSKTEKEGLLQKDEAPK